MTKSFVKSIKVSLLCLLSAVSFIHAHSVRGGEFNRIYQEYLDENYPKVLVTAHRGGYQQFGAVIHPENSLSAISYSIGLGVDIVEIDVRKTLDGELVVIHDETVDRTTTGSGTVTNMTLAQIKSLDLLYLNQPTGEKVPTLTEVMQLAEGQIMVNIDKAFDIMEDVVQVLEATDTLDHAIFKGRTSSASIASNALGSLSATVDYMPILHTGDSIVSYFSELSPESVEMIFSTPNSNLVAPTVINYTNSNGGRVGMSSLSTTSAAGHTDGNALLDPAGNWGWMVDKGAQIIQTDEPEALIQYLESEGLRRGNGDFNDDGKVDGRDFLLWQRGGSPSPLSSLDFLDWQDGYGNTIITTNVAIVPEPSTIAVLLVCFPVVVMLRHRETQASAPLVLFVFAVSTLDNSNGCGAQEGSDPTLTSFPPIEEFSQESDKTNTIDWDTEVDLQVSYEERLDYQEGRQPGGGSHIGHYCRNWQAADSPSTDEISFDVAGRVHLDYWGFPVDSPGVNAFETGDPNFSPQDRFGFRRIRIGASGELDYSILYELEIEFAAPDNVQFRDVFFGWDELPLVQMLLIGNQKRPYGLDHLNSSNDNVFMERPFVVEAFNQDARRLGVCAYGYSEDLAWNWRYGAFNQRLIQDEGSYISDHLQGQLAGRLAHTNWLNGQVSGPDYLHLAFAGTWADTDADAVGENFAGSGISEASFRTRPEARTVSRWLDTGVILEGDDYTLLGLEGVLNVGPFQMATEYQTLWLDRASLETLSFHGGYVYISYFLTGEHLPWDAKIGTLDAVEPRTVFSLSNDGQQAIPRGPGAWQVALRWSYGDLADGEILGGVGESVTAGLNWYWNPHTRIQFNYIYGEIGENTFNSSAGSPAKGIYQILGTRAMVHY